MKQKSNAAIVQDLFHLNLQNLLSAGLLVAVTELVRAINCSGVRLPWRSALLLLHGFAFVVRDGFQNCHLRLYLQWLLILLTSISLLNLQGLKYLQNPCVPSVGYCFRDYSQNFCFQHHQCKSNILCSYCIITNNYPIKTRSRQCKSNICMIMFYNMR